MIPWAPTSAVLWIGALGFLFLMLVFAVTDLLAMRISNRLVASFAIAWLILAPLAGISVMAMGASALGALAILALGVAAFAFGVMGGGDGKLAAATALWIGPAALPAYLLHTALIGGVLALAILALRARPLPRSLRGRRWLRRLHAPGRGIPYGIALAAAGVISLQGTIWWPGGA